MADAAHTTESNWTEVAHFSAQYEADFAVARLESAGIPTLTKGNETGALGPGMAGATPSGVSVFVPSAAFEQAKLTLGLD